MPITIKGSPSLMLRRHEASQYLLSEWGLSYTVDTLAVMAGERRGPPYHLLGNRAFYPLEELNAWAESRLSPLLNTVSEPPKRRAHQIPEQMEA
jgi:hypothetical protein